MGLPWLAAMGPVQLHAWRMYECSFNDTAQCEYQQGYWRFWYGSWKISYKAFMLI